MTEYDYSPDAMERYQAKMAGVGKWANEQSYWRTGYTNPFTPEVSSPSSAPRPTSRPETSSSRSRPQPTRSRTLPANLAVPAAKPGGSSAHGHTSRALAYAQADPRAVRPSTGTPTRTTTRHRSGSQPAPVDVRTPYPYPAPAPGQKVVQAPRGSPMVYAPPGARVIYKEYDYVPGKATVLPPARPGERFVVVPPPGGRVDVMSADRLHSSSHTRSNSRSSGSKSSGSSPTKRSGDPLFKRILTNLKPNIEWGHDRDSSRSRSSSRREGSKLRSASR
ncbi:hypothetical protein BD309DRAFT_78025 [Dichomitus squalens]|uniref:Uncharacterized protein n=1 Tax=Dichomitus squalens TaxID=114155 RepID=A0A4Q9NQQ3_9APHY|nr:hypothetical protein BD309DRAFT_78025 [Dichomitus squalens]TBU56679.1 hypothetical protein BD310DRAFT_599752 [Dichomitus squalens]